MLPLRLCCKKNKFIFLKKIQHILCLITLTMLCASVAAQESNGLLTPNRKTEIGVTAGCSYYMGDFNESVVPYMVSPMFGVLFRYNFNKYVNVRAQISAGRVQGDSRDYEGGLPGFPRGVNLGFKRNFYAAEAYGEFNFFPFSSVDPRRKQIFTPVLIVGLGYVLYDKNKIDNDPYRANALATYPAMYDTMKYEHGIAIPMGFGFKYSPAKQWTVGVECIFKKTNTDHIDKFINRQDGDKFNIYNKDWVTTIALTVSYRFVNPKACATYATNKKKGFKEYNGLNTDLNKKKKKRVSKKKLNKLKQ